MRSSARSAVAAGFLLGVVGCRPEVRTAPLRLAARPLPASVTAPAAAAVTQPALTVPGSGEAGGERLVRLPSGALLVLQEDHIVKTVALQAWVLAGAADEPEPQLGIAHLTERLLFHEQAQDAVQRVYHSGGEAASWTTPDHTVFHALVPSRRWEQGIEFLGALLGARRSELAVSESALDRQRQVVLTELRQEAAVPQRAALQALLSVAFAAHPYRRPVLGRAETLRKVTRAEIAEFFASRYTASRLTVVVTGDFDAAALAARLSAELGTTLLARAASDPQPPERPVEPPQQTPRVAVLPQDSEPGRARVLLGFHLPSARSADVAALDIAAVLLGYGEGARLHRELARTQRLDGSEEPSAMSYTARDPGLLLTGIVVAPAQIEDAARVLFSEALRLGQREVTAADLQRAQRVLLADDAYLRETPSGRARRLGFFHSLGLVPRNYEKQVQSLTPLALRQTLSRYLTPENLTLVALRPPPGNATNGRTDAGAEPTAGLVRRLQLQLSQSVAALGPMAPRAAAMATQVKPVPGGTFAATLPSGARLLIVPEHSVGIVGIAALWPGGLRGEDERSAGAHQLLARLWPRSVRTRTADAMARELEQLSGTLSPVVELDAFGLRGEFVSSHLDQGLALLADCLSQPSFSDVDADRERRSLSVELRGDARAEHNEPRTAPASLLGALEPLGVNSEVTAAQLLPRDDAARAALRLFKSALLPGHPYALEPSVQSVGGLSRRRLLELFRRSYPLTKLTIAVVGDVDPQTVLERLDARLPAAAAVSPPAVAAPTPPPELPSTPASRVLYLPSQHAHMVLGFRAPGLQARERYALEILFELLAGPAGRLSRELRDKRGLAYAVQGVLQLGVELGFIALHLATSPSTFDVAQTGLREELRKLIDHPITAAELILAQDQLVSRQAAGRQRRDDYALELARIAALGLPAGAAGAEAYEAGVRAVSIAEVQSAASRYLDDPHAVVAAVLPEALHHRTAGSAALLARMHEDEPPRSGPAELPKKLQLASRQLNGLIPADGRNHRGTEGKSKSASGAKVAHRATSEQTLRAERGSHAQAVPAAHPPGRAKAPPPRSKGR